MRLVGRLFRKYRKYLQVGTYELNDSRTCFSKKDDENIVLDFATLAAGRRRFRICRKYQVKETNGKFLCTKMLLTDLGKIVKCFDFESGIVISFFRNAERMKEWIHIKETAMDCFESSTILECDEDELYVVEVLLRDTATSSKEKWECVLKYYAEHCFSGKGQMWENLPIVYQHGDLWSENVFCDESKCRVIDFDHVGYHMFFYDLALYMFTEAFIKKDKTLLEMFLEGKYDFWIDKICKNYDVDYVRIGRAELFSSAMREMISTRFSTPAGKQITADIVQYLAEVGINI